MECNTGFRKLPSTFSNKTKETAAQRFAEYGNQIRELVQERQQLNIKIENVNKDKIRMEEGDKGLDCLLASTDPALAFLELDTDWEPKKVKNQMQGFQNLIKSHQNQFHRAPIGPLFSHVTIKNSLWCKLVEKILIKFLCTFVVDNIEDEIVLQGLASIFRGPFNRLEQFGETPLEIHIFVVPFKEKFIPQPRHKIMDKLTFRCSNLLDTLKFSDEEESHTWKIVIGKEINAENSFLFTTEHDAFVFMYSQSSVPSFKTVLAYSLDGYQIFPFPQFKTSAIKIPKQLSFFSVDRSEDVAYLTAATKELEVSRKLYDHAIQNLRELQLAALQDWEGKEDENNNDGQQNNANYTNFNNPTPHLQSLYETSIGKYKTTSL